MPNKKQLTPRLNKLEPNLIIDGGMEIWPEGTSRSVANNNLLYGGALYRCQNASTGITLTNSQQSSIPSGTVIPFSNQVSKTAAGTLAAGTISRLITYIEGYNIHPIINSEFSVIFWVKSSVASNRSVSIQNTGITHSYVKQYNISAANTWELKVLTFPALSTCPGVIDRANNYALAISHNIVVGSSFQTGTLNSWQSGAFASGVGEDTTWLTGTTHDFSIAGVMALPGDWTSLQTNTSSYMFLRSGRNFQEELAATQRYYSKSYDLGTIPGSTNALPGSMSFATTVASSNTAFTAIFPVSMRTTPTVTAYNPVTGSTATPQRGYTGGNNYSASIQASGDSGAFWLQGATVIDYYIMQWTADARF